MHFLEYFHHNVTHIRLVDKRESTLMRTADALIKVGNVLRITNIKDDRSTVHDESFMGGYGTTIGRTIYESPAWRWDRLPTPHVLHELTHVVQFSPMMALRYVLSAKWRMYYESECVQAEVLLDPKKSCVPLWFESKVAQFMKYGCSEKLVKNTLRKRIVEVMDNKPLSNPKKVHDAYKIWAKENEYSP